MANHEKNCTELNGHLYQVLTVKHESEVWILAYTNKHWDALLNAI